MPLVKLWQLLEHQTKRDVHHRAWGWMDEWSWFRNVYIPYSFAGWVDKGVVLEPGAAGEWDSASVHQPCILRVGNEWLMYYTGRSGAWKTTARIGLAKSVDGLTWTKVGKLFDPPAGYDACGSPFIIYDFYETDLDWKWKLICDAYNPGTGVWEPQYYRSSDGLTWVYVRALTIPGTHLTPYPFMRVGNAYFIFSRDSGTFEVRLYVTRDFDVFFDYGIVLKLGAAGEWDSVKFGYLSIFWNLGVWYMLVQATDTGVHPYRLGIAVSSNGFDWFKYPPNPIIDVGPAGSWYETSVLQASFAVWENRFRIYATGRDAGGIFRIGLFEIEA